MIFTAFDTYHYNLEVKSSANDYITTPVLLLVNYYILMNNSIHVFGVLGFGYKCGNADGSGGLAG